MDSIGIQWKSPVDFTISPPNLDKNCGKFVLQTFNLGLPLCQQKSYRTLVDSTGVHWSPVDSYRNKGGRVKPSRNQKISQHVQLEIWILCNCIVTSHTHHAQMGYRDAILSNAENSHMQTRSVSLISDLELGTVQISVKRRRSASCPYKCSENIRYFFKN